MKPSDSNASLNFFRSIIRDAWLPLVGRRKLTSTEYAYVSELFTAHIELDVILKAIKKCRDRARSSNYTIYSLGVIRSDLATIMVEKSRTQVGAAKPVDENAWREQWHNDLAELLDLVDEPLRSAYRGLLTELDSLSRDQAQARWLALQKPEKQRQ